MRSCSNVSLCIHHLYRIYLFDLFSLYIAQGYAVTWTSHEGLEEVNDDYISSVVGKQSTAPFSPENTNQSSTAYFFRCGGIASSRPFDLTHAFENSLLWYR